MLQKLDEKILELAALPNLQADCTNRHPWGKVQIKVNKITNFPFQGNVFIRFTLQPWVVETKKCIDGKMDFNQTFYLPVANHFFTIKAEVINMHADGWLREHFKESILYTFEIRIPDLNKEPFLPDGSIKLPLS